MIRILFFQIPEWSEDYRDWKRERYIKCTYNGVQLSEREFPQKKMANRWDSDKNSISFSSKTLA